MKNSPKKIIKLQDELFVPSRLKNKRKDSNHEVVIGTLASIRDKGEILVDFPDNPHGALTALSTVDIRQDDVNRSVLLVFENGNLRRPIITGLIKEQPLIPSEAISIAKGDIRELFSGEENIILDVRKRFEIRCGKSSLVLNEDGRVVIKGTRLVSRASEINKIKGAAVKIN